MAKRRRKAHSRRKHRRVSGDPSLAPSVVSGTRRRRRSKVKAKSHRRKRRSGMGAITGSDAGDMLLGLGLGLGAGIIADIAGSKFLPGKEKIIDGAKLLLGAAGAIKMKKPLQRGLSMGLAGQGAMKLAHDIGLVSGMEQFIHGIGDGKDTMLIEMNGVDLNSTRIMNGSNQEQPPVVNGDGDGQTSGTMPSVVE